MDSGRRVAGEKRAVQACSQKPLSSQRGIEWSIAMPELLNNADWTHRSPYSKESRAHRGRPVNRASMYEVSIHFGTVGTINEVQWTHFLSEFLPD